MKAISLHQPWAQAVVFDEKSIETRSWSTSYRGPLAIHATKRQPSAAEIAELGLGLVAWNGSPETTAARRRSLPLGAIVGVVDLYDVCPVEEVRDLVTLAELRWGDYSDGRYAWMLYNARILPRPIPLKGQRRCWGVREDVERLILEEAVEPGMIRVV